MDLFSFRKALFDAYTQQEYAERAPQPVGIHTRCQQRSSKSRRNARRDAPKGRAPFDQPVFAMRPERGGRASKKVQQVDSRRLILCNSGQHGEIQHEQRTATHTAAG